MAMLLKSVLLLASACLATSAPKNFGPGTGPWVVASPEEHGLSSAELQAAADRTKENYSGRKCYLVVKNGEIVFEKYWEGWSESTTTEGYSSTKSSCGGALRNREAARVGRPRRQGRGQKLKRS